ncbi:MAG: AAA family ATPase [Candidatus Nanopelagicales bacterium]
MLVGRDELVTRIDWVVASARAGAGAALLLRGDPGAGKSALLSAARESASAAGLRVVATAGVDDERELPYAGLHALLRVLDADGVDLVPAHRSALDAALGLDDGSRPGTLVVATALLAVLDARSTDVPLLVAVDDLHWVDAESRAVLAFASRRIADNAVAVVAATRPPLALPGIETAEVLDLDTASALALLRGEGAADSVVAHLVATVGGNPLALLEVCRSLAPAQRDGSEPLPEPLPLTSAGAAYAAQLATADEGVRLAAGVAATAGEIDPRRLHEVLEARGTTWSALGGLEPLGLARVDRDGVRWRHPLARAAARDALDPGARRVAHLATAEVLEQADGDPATIAWHYVRSAGGPDPVLAERISAVAATASARGAHVAAAEAYEAAASLTPDRVLAAESAAHAGIERWHADDGARARELLEQALPGLVDDDLRWDTALTLAQVVGSIDAATAAYDAHRVCVEVARHQQRRDREVRALAQAFNSSTHVGPEATDAVVADIVTAADPSDPVQVARREAVLGFADLRVDRTETGRAHLEVAMDLIESGDLLTTSPDLLQLAVQAVMWSGQTQRLRDQISGVVAQMAAQGDLRILPSTVRGLAWCDYAGGRWQSAAELADQALDLARMGERAADVCESLAQVATLDGVRGHLGSALAHAEESREMAEAMGSTWRVADACWGETLALLGAVDLARLDDAATRFATAVRSLVPGQFQPEYLDAAIALALVGRRDEAGDLVGTLVAGLDDDQRPEVRVGATLAALHVEPDDAQRAEAAAALAGALVGADDYPFGRGRLRLAAGAMTRRLGNRTQARALLREAEQDFEALGAAPWLERTRDELRASGATLRSAATPDAGLTAAEARVCRAAATGMSTKEIAASLFLSPKTVEFHLGRIFRKLGVRSRAELVSVLAAQDRA